MVCNKLDPGLGPESSEVGFWRDVELLRLAFGAVLTAGRANKSTTLTHTPRSFCAEFSLNSSIMPSSSALVRSLTILSVDSTCSSSARAPDTSEGALLASRPALALLAACAPIFNPAHTPLATPPPISTAEVRRAVCPPCEVLY